MPDWPPTGRTDRTWYLGSGGRLDDAPTTDDGAATNFRYDPMDPTPSVGGRVLAHRAGRRDNRRLEARADVRAFTTAPLEEPAELLGGAPVTHRIGHSAASPSSITLAIASVPRKPTSGPGSWSDSAQGRRSRPAMISARVAAVR